MLPYYESLIDAEEVAILIEQGDTLNLITVPHRIEQTQQLKELVPISYRRINQLRLPILEARKLSQSKAFKKEARKLCSRCQDLEAHIQTTNKFLDEDLDRFRRIKEQEERNKTEKQKLDYAKIATFYVLTIGAFVAAVRNGVGDGVVTIYQAMAAGFVLCSGVTCHKQIKAGFKGAMRIVCSAPQKISGAAERMKRPVSKALGLLRHRPKLG